MADRTDGRGAPVLLRRSPLDGLTAASDDGAVRLAERPFLTMVSLRVDPDSAAARRVEGVLGMPLPRECGRVEGSGAHHVLWLGPDEWLIVTERDTEMVDSASSVSADVLDAAALVATLRDASQMSASAEGDDNNLLDGSLSRTSGKVGRTPAVVDVSANRTVLELSGPAARAVLEKGCPVDLHPRAFQPGTAVSTTLTRIPMLLWQTGPEEYRLLPRSSFAGYVSRWLLDAMAEFGADIAAEAALVGDGA